MKSIIAKPVALIAPLVCSSVLAAPISITVEGELPKICQLTQTAPPTEDTILFSLEEVDVAKIKAHVAQNKAIGLKADVSNGFADQKLKITYDDTKSKIGKTQATPDTVDNIKIFQKGGKAALDFTEVKKTASTQDFTFDVEKGKSSNIELSLAYTNFLGADIDTNDKKAKLVFDVELTCTP